MSQKDRVLADLRDAGLEGVCSAHWYRTACPNARNRVGELERDHYHIASMPCGDDHGRTPYYRYVLLHGPERTCEHCPWAPEQVRLIA